MVKFIVTARKYHLAYYKFIINFPGIDYLKLNRIFDDDRKFMFFQPG